jgi:HlyD family secretion protein
VQEEGVYAERAALEIQIGQVEESISKCLVISPINGTVLTKFAEAGEVTSFGKPMLKLADLTQMELKVYVSGDQLPYLKIGEKVKVMIDKNRKDLQEMSGVVSWISSTAEFTPKTIQTREERVNLVYAAKIIVPNDGTLKIGMPGEIDFMPAD